jgi:DNA-binding XRE family transcriptional regulator
VVKTDREYRDALRQIEVDRAQERRQRAALVDLELSDEQVERAMAPLLAFNVGLREDVAWYERVRRGDFGLIRRLTEIGRLLIALRIAAGISQRELARRLQVDESQVSRDERNEYFGVTLERAQRVLDALNASTITTVAEPRERGEPAPSR